MSETKIVLPQVMIEIARVAGMSAAWELVRAQGGRNVYIPAKVNEGHWLAQLVGLDAAQKICDHYAANGAGNHLLVPLAKTAMQRERMIKALEAGMSAPEAAAAAGMHVRSAYRAREKFGLKDTRQKDLFE